MTPTATTPPAKPNGHAVIPQALPVGPAATASAPTPQQNPGPAPAGDAEVRKIPLAEIDEHPRETRKEYDLERGQELKASMQENGQLNAIIVYLDPETKRYRRIAGGRRCRAAEALGWTDILARILPEPPDDAKASLLVMIDNDARQDLSDIERGLAYQNYMSRTGCTASALASKVGKSVSTVTRAAKLALKLSPYLRERVEAGMPSSIAQELLSLSGKTQQTIARQYPDTLKTRAEVIAAIKASKNGHTPSATSGFTFQDRESGVRIAVTFPGQDLSRAEAVLCQLVKDLGANGNRGVEKFKEFLSKKTRAAQKAAELKAAQDELAGLTNPASSTLPPAAK